MPKQALTQVSTVTRIPSPRPDPALARQLAEIGQEGFSPSDLLRARVMAGDRNLRFINDLDAVRVLRSKGIQLSPTRSKADLLPRLQSAPDHQASHDMLAIDRILEKTAQGRKRKSRRAILRLAAFVLAPTAAAALYFAAIATPIYVTYSEFVIQRPDQPMAGMAGAAMAGSALAGHQDAISVQGFLSSRAALQELDEREHFTEHFASEEIDILQRIRPGATSEQIFRAYRRHVDVSFDPTEGIVRLRVEATAPQVSRDFSHTLISLAEAHLDQMTHELRADQVETAQGALSRAEAAVAETQAKLVAFQEGSSVLSGDLEMTLLQEQIGTLEVRLIDARLGLEELSANRQPAAAKVDAAERRVRLLEQSIAEKRARITNAARGGTSLAGTQAELLVLQAELASRQQVQTESSLELNRARSEAGRQARYLALGVEPVLPGAPEFPRPIINTLMALASFLGIYLLASLSVTLIREQIMK